MLEVKILNTHTQSVQYLIKKDKRLARVIDMVGEISYKPYDNSYSFLISQIIGQMLSAKVSDILYARLQNLCSNNITPKSISELSDEQIKSIGISNSKVRFIRELTISVVEGKLDFEKIKLMDDESAIKYLTNIYGIGKWSAKMYLIFALDRQDILPYEDVAFLQAYKWLYKVNVASPEMVIKKCKKWKPFSSIAARYMYRALDMGYTKEEFSLNK